MNKLVLFLDMDGVFNVCAGNETTYKMTGMHFEKHLVERFNQFLDEHTDVKLIISSSWRDQMDDTQKQLEKAGFRYWDRVIGRTALTSISRGQLIMDVVVAGKIENYLVIDDYIDEIICCDIINNKRVIATSSYTGLSEENYNQINSFINK